MSEIITFGAIDKGEARQLMKEGKKVCYWGRKQDNCAKIIKVNPSFAVLDNGYKVRYKALTPEDKYVPHAEYIKKPSYQARQKKFSGSTQDYEKSNASSIRPIPKSKLGPMQTSVKKMGACLDSMRKARKQCANLESAQCQASFEDDRKCVEKNAQTLINRLNAHYKLPNNKIYVDGTRKNYRSDGDLYGYYRPRTGMIRVFPYTKKRQDVVANKTFLDTTIHEWNHHYDHHKLKLKDSFHTAGFGKRITTIKNQLKTVFD